MSAKVTVRIFFTGLSFWHVNLFQRLHSTTTSLLCDGEVFTIKRKGFIVNSDVFTVNGEVFGANGEVFTINGDAFLKARMKAATSTCQTFGGS